MYKNLNEINQDTKIPINDIIEKIINHFKSYLPKDYEIDYLTAQRLLNFFHDFIIDSSKLTFAGYRVTNLSNYDNKSTKIEEHNTSNVRCDNTLKKELQQEKSIKASDAVQQKIDEQISK